MIKYETIISNFDDKTTLYNWLRKVEEALKHASATNFVVNKKGNATLSFSITFADGTTLESGDIVLQQGESVDAVRIASGILQLHLTNGTWLTAGNIKPVNNFEINASQHLIVNYQDGTSQDLGAIFNGNITISGSLDVTGSASVGGDLNVTGDVICDNLDPNYIFCNGAISGSEIKERMSGYSFIKTAITGLTKNYHYAGVVKNGDKITFVIFADLTKTGGLSNNFSLGTFTCPLDVMAKIYPVQIGAINLVEARKVYLASAYNAGITLNGYVEKTGGGSQLAFYLNGGDDMADNTTYACRFELTLLLSDNMAQ